MWLLNTSSTELKFFARPEDVPGGYAILSHVWDLPEYEDTFQRAQESSRLRPMCVLSYFRVLSLD